MNIVRAILSSTLIQENEKLHSLHTEDDAVVKCVDDAFGLAVLGGSIGAGQTEDDAMALAVASEGNVIKFLPVISLNGKYG